LVRPAPDHLATFAYVRFTDLPGFDNRFRRDESGFGTGREWVPTGREWVRDGAMCRALQV